MNTIEIGRYIKRKRIEMHLTQKDLAEKLNLSFQAISKWETGSTLPDTSILLQLSDELEVTVDQILNAGELRERMNKKVDIKAVIETIRTIFKAKNILGPNNGIYKSMMEGINKERDVDFEESWKDKHQREVIVAKSVIQLIVDGYHVDEEDVNNYFATDKIKDVIMKYQSKYNQ